MSLTRAIASNTAVQVAGKFVGNVLGVLTMAVITRSLGAAGFGAFTTAISFLQLFGILVDFGLTLTMTSLLSAPGADQDRIASNVFTLRLVSALAFFGLAPVLALAFPYSPDVRTAIAVGALSFFAMACSGVLTGIFQKNLATGMAALADVLGRTVLFIGALYAWYTDAGLLTFIWALVLGNALQFAVAFASARRLARIRLAFDFGTWKRIISESWPIGVSIAFNLIYLKGDVIVLSLSRPQAEVGLYGAAYKVLDVVTVVPMIFMGLVLPLLTAAWLAGNREEFARKTRRSFDAMTVLALPLAFGAWPVARDLMVFVSGEEFAGSGIYLAILMLAGAAVFWGGLFGHAVVALGIQRKMIWAYAADAAISLALYAWAVPKYGGLGAAWVTVFAETFILLVNAIAVLAIAKVRLPWRTFAAALAASALMAAAVNAAESQHVLLRVLLGMIVYTFLLALFGVLNKELLSSLRRTAAAPSTTAV